MDHSGSDHSLRLFAECYSGGDYLTVEVFGRGVGIWNGEREFRASAEEIETAVRAALDAGFPEMAPSYGGEPDRRPPRREADPPGAAPVRLLCAVEARVGDRGKRVEQLARGAQSEALLSLGERWLSLWRAPGEAGLGAADLDDGLAKLAAGRLSPETLRLSLHEKPELPRSPGTGFLMRLRGRELTSRPFAAGSGYAAPLGLELTAAEFERLAGRMSALRPGRLPVNLFADEYLDLSIELLDHRLSVQARRFAGMTRGTHGEAQRDFDLLLEELRRLNQRALDKKAPS